MNPSTPKNEAILYRASNWAFHTISKRVPYFGTHLSDESLASWSGAIATILAAYSVGKPLVYPSIITPIAKGLGLQVSLDDVVLLSLVGTAAAVVVPHIVAKKEVEDWKKAKPVYSSGIKGIVAGAFIAGLFQLGMSSYTTESSPAPREFKYVPTEKTVGNFAKIVTT